eukprot:Selendium_serpulae@DN6283_c3_g6_i1.p1
MDHAQLDGLDAWCLPGEAKGYSADELIFALGSFLEECVASHLNKISPDERFITSSPRLTDKRDLLARQATLVPLECSDVFTCADVDFDGDDDFLSAAKPGEGGPKLIGGALKFPIANAKGDNCESCLTEFEMADLPTTLPDQTPLRSGTPHPYRSDAGSEPGDAYWLRGTGHSESRQDLLGDQFF